MNPDSHDRVAHLTEELERVGRELAQLQQATRQSGPRGLLRWGRLMTTVPLLLVGTWVLSAQGAHTAAGDYLDVILLTALVLAVALPLYYYRNRIIGLFRG